MKLFVTGQTGLLGSKIVHCSNSKVYPQGWVDITTEKIRRSIRRSNPDVVIHCAAFTDVDGCEVEKEKAWNVNVKGTENVAKACQEVDARMIYVSTDYVFDGENGMYKETDEPHPINYYGKTKLEGERKVKEICEDYVIARTSVLYGWHERLNFVTWVIKQLKKNDKIQIVTDQYTSPTSADNLAEVLLEIAENNLHGVHHTAGSERVNRHDFTLKIAEVFDLDKGLITPIISEELDQIARRPRDSSLSIEKIKNKIDTDLVGIEKGLQRMRA